MKKCYTLMNDERTFLGTCPASFANYGPGKTRKREATTFWWIYVLYNWQQRPRKSGYHVGNP